MDPDSGSSKPMESASILIFFEKESFGGSLADPKNSFRLIKPVITSNIFSSDLRLCTRAPAREGLQPRARRIQSNEVRARVSRKKKTWRKGSMEDIKEEGKKVKMCELQFASDR